MVCWNKHLAIPMGYYACFFFHWALLKKEKERKKKKFSKEYNLTARRYTYSVTANRVSWVRWSCACGRHNQYQGKKYCNFSPRSDHRPTPLLNQQTNTATDPRRWLRRGDSLMRTLLRHRDQETLGMLRRDGTTLIERRRRLQPRPLRRVEVSILPTEKRDWDF